MKFAYLIFIVSFVVSCGGRKSDNDELNYEVLEEAYERNLNKWNELAPVNYSFDESFNWYCNESDESAVTHIVKDGNSTTYTMEDLFITVKQKIEMRSHYLYVKYDDVYGFPLTIDYDDYDSIADDEFCIVVSSFEVSAIQN